MPWLDEQPADATPPEAVDNGTGTGLRPITSPMSAPDNYEPSEMTWMQALNPPTIADFADLAKSPINAVQGLTAALTRHGIGWADDPNYDVFEDPQVHGYEDNADYWFHSKSAGQTRAILDRLNANMERQERLAEAPWVGGAAQLIGGLFEPSIAITGVGGALAARGLAEGSAFFAGNRLARGAIEGLAGAVGATPAYEAEAYGADPTRTLSDTGRDLALNVALGVTLGSLLEPNIHAPGAARPKTPEDNWPVWSLDSTDLTSKWMTEMAAQSLPVEAGKLAMLRDHVEGNLRGVYRDPEPVTVTKIERGADGRDYATFKDQAGKEGRRPLDDLMGPQRPPEVPAEVRAASAESARIGSPSAAAGGAAAADHSTLADNTLMPAFGVNTLLAHRMNPFYSPIHVLATSSSNFARKVGRRLAEQSGKYYGELHTPAPQSAQTRAKFWINSTKHFTGAVRKQDELFLKYRKAGSKLFGGTRAGLSDLTRAVTRGKLGKAGGAMSKIEFNEAVGKAMRRGDKSEVPEVAEAAKAWRDMVVDPLWKRAKEAMPHLKDKELELALSYLTRRYDLDAIAKNRFGRDANGKAIGFQDIIADHIGAQRLDAINADPALRDGWKSRVAAAKAAVETHTKKIEELAKAEKESVARIKALTKKVPKLIERERALKSRVGKLEPELEYIKTRAKRVEETGKLDPNDPLVFQIDHARQVAFGKIKEPERLTKAIRRMGGVTDPGGDLKAMGMKPMKAGGIIRESDPKLEHGMDKLSVRLAEEQWLGTKFDATDMGGTYQDLDPEDIMSAIQQDVGANGKAASSDNPVYNEQQSAREIEDWKSSKELINEVVDKGGNFKMTNEEIAHRIGALDGDAFHQHKLQNTVANAKAELEKTKKELDEGAAEIKAKEAELRTIEADATNHAKALRREERDAARNEKYIEEHDDLRLMPESDIQWAAAQVVNKIMGLNGRGTLEPIEVGPSPGGKSIKAITLKIPDLDIEDFLIHNAEQVMRSYTRQMAHDVEIAAMFDGQPGMEDAIKGIEQEYSALLQSDAQTIRLKNKDATPEKIDELVKASQVKLNAEMRRVLDKTVEMRDTLRGVFDLPANPQALARRVVRSFKQVNLMTKGGGFAIAAITDPANIRLVHSYSDMVGRKGLLGFITQLHTFKMNAREADLFTAGADLVTSGRVSALADVADDVVGGNVVEKGIAALAAKFPLVNLMNVETAAVKRLNAGLSINQTLDIMDRHTRGLASEKELARMRWLGLNPDDAARYVAATKKHGSWGTRAEGRWPNTQAWDEADQDIAEALGYAIAKDTDMAIVTPGLEKPIWMGTQYGSIVTQFRSFAISSMSRTTLRALQQGDHKAAAAFISAIAWGMLAYRLKVPDERRADPTTQWYVWVKEGIDRSGMMGYVFELNNTLESATGYGLSPALGVPGSERFRNQNVANMLIGPGAGIFNDAAAQARAIAEGKFDESFWKRQKRITPYAGIFYFKAIGDAVAAATGEDEELGPR